MTYEWRTMANWRFANDEIDVWLGARNGDRFDVAHPCEIQFTSHPIGALVDTPEQPFLRLPRQAAEALFDALAREFFGKESAQLRAQLELEKRARERAESRLDRLIDGLGARATAPGKYPVDPSRLPSGNQP